MENRKSNIVSALGIVIILGVVLGIGGWRLTARSPLFFATPTSLPTATPWPIPYHFDSPEYGVNVHMWWDPWAAVARDWHLVEEAGFTWVKQRLAWQDVEGDGPGLYIWAGPDRIVEEAEAAGVKLIFRVDHPPAWAVPSVETPGGHGFPVDAEMFAQFCEVLAARYRGRVAGYQIWNEPNLSREWHGYEPDPSGYVTLLRACYVNIKRADPNALVVSAGLSPTGSGPPEALPDVTFLEGMYKAGAAPYFDLLGLNAPGYKAPPELAPEQAADPENGYGGHPVFCFRHVEALRAIMEHYGDSHKQVAILEFGWHTNDSPTHPDYAWFAVTPEQQADYLVRAFQYANEHWSPWIGPMFVWNIPDARWTPDNEEFWWGIVDPFWWGFDGNYSTWKGAGVRPAYEALKNMPKP